MGFIHILWGVATGVQLLAILLYAPVRRSWKGRYISKPLIRRLGFRRTYGVRVLLIFINLSGFIFSGNDWRSLPSCFSCIAFAVWMIDDALGDDDDYRRRYYEWAKVKLKKLRPVRLRPAERWAPAPA